MQLLKHERRVLVYRVSPNAFFSEPKDVREGDPDQQNPNHHTHHFSHTVVGAGDPFRGKDSRTFGADFIS